MIKEGFFSELTISIVADYHSLVSMGNAALVADVRPSQCVVSRDHHHPNLGLLQLSDRCLRLRFQLVLEHLKAVETQTLFGHLASDGLVVISLNAFATNREHSEAVGGVLLEHFVVVIRYRGLLHDCGHHFGRTLRVGE